MKKHIKYVVLSVIVLSLFGLVLFGFSSTSENLGSGIVLSKHEIKGNLVSVVQMKGGKRISAFPLNKMIIEGDKVDVFRRVGTFYSWIIADDYFIQPVKNYGEMISIGKIISSTKSNNTFNITITDGIDTFDLKSKSNFNVGQQVDLYLNENKETIIVNHEEWMDTILSTDI